MITTNCVTVLISYYHYDDNAKCRYVYNEHDVYRKGNACITREPIAYTKRII